MSIDITKITSLVNQLSNTSGPTKSNTYSFDFAEYLMNSLAASSNNTLTANDFSSVLQVNLNDKTTLKSTIEQALNQSSAADLTQLLNNPNNLNTYSLSNLFGANSSSSETWNDLFKSHSSQTSALQTLTNTSSVTEDTISNALHTNFLSKQMNLIQTAYNKLQVNLEDYKERNVGIESEDVRNRIAEMTKNVSAVQTYMQEKLSEKASNESLLNKLNANGQLASINFK